MEENKVRLQGLTFFCTEHQVLTKGTLVFDTFHWLLFLTQSPELPQTLDLFHTRGENQGNSNTLMN